MTTTKSDSAEEVPTAEASEAKVESLGKNQREAHYRVNQEEEPPFLYGSNAPNLQIHVDRGLTVDRNSRKNYPEQTIFLDGVFSGAPFLDNEKRQYSLDHHAGCVRIFTLASCEQAAVMVLKGLPLEQGAWHVYLNNPDLDAVLACWILVNQRTLLRDDRKLFRRVMPFVRVEGIIDGHGLEMSLLSGLRADDYQHAREKIDRLLVEERRLKATGQWERMDPLAYTQRLLSALDHELFPEGYLERILEISELAQMPIQNGKIAVLCRSQQGIYAVEAELLERYRKQLGIIILDLGSGRFTLRQVDQFMTKTLNDVYPRLNRKDPDVDQANSDGNRWGGASDIGGSPRDSGSGLDGQEIMRIVADVYSEGGFWRRIFGRRTS